MRKIFAFLLSLVILLGLFGCSASPSDSAPPVGSHSPSPGGQGGNIEECKEYSENGYYYTDEIVPGSMTLIYIDFTTLQEVALCPRPECLHEDETCPAFFPNGIGDVFVIGDSLFSFQGTGKGGPTDFVQADLSGANPQKRLQLPENYEPLPYGYYSDGSSIYFAADETTETEEGKLENRILLLRVDMVSWEYVVVHQFPVGEPAHILQGSFERNLFFVNFLIDPYGELYTAIDCWDADTGTIDHIKTMDKTIDGSVYGAYLFEIDRNECTISRTSLITNESTIYNYSAIFENSSFTSEIQVGFEPLFDTILQLGVVEIREEGSLFHDFLLDMQTGEIWPFTLFQPYRPSQHVPVLVDFGDKLIVRPDWVVEYKTYFGYTNPFYSPLHAVISKEDYIHSIPNYEYIPSFRINTLPGT